MGSKEEANGVTQFVVVKQLLTVATTGQKLKHNYLCADIYFDKTDSPIILQL